MINPIVKTIELGDGRTITLETGKLAKQADGSVMLRMGNTHVARDCGCAAQDAGPGCRFHAACQVEYKEKFAACRPLSREVFNTERRKSIGLRDPCYPV